MRLLPLVDEPVSGGDTADTDGFAPLAGTSALERQLWLVVLVAMVLDIATTAYGLSTGLIEQNPLVRWAVETYGLVALPAFKLGALTVALACRWACPAYGVVVPLGVAVPWSLAVGINLAFLLGLG